MHAKLIALLFSLWCSCRSRPGRPKAATYTRDLEQEAVRARITGIVDGDTIKVLTAAKQQIRVRIAFIDVPEKGQAFGQRAN